MTNTDVTTYYDEYDAMGRVLSITKEIAGDTESRTTYTDYDLSGKVIDISYDDGFEVSNTYYPGTGLLESVTGTPDGTNFEEYARCTAYEPTGKIGYIYHDYNDTETAYSYDLKTTRLEGLETFKPSPSGGYIQHKTYTYFPSGDIHEIKELYDDGSEKFKYTYEYDNLHRLLSEDVTGNSYPTTSTEVLIYTYDNNDKPNAVRNINYNGSDYGFTYDANGNMKSGPDFSNPNNVVTRTIQWNADNMPTHIAHPTNGNTDFTYDGDGARAKKVAGETTTYYISNDYEIKNGVTTNYIFAGNLRVATIDDNNTHIFHKDHLGSSTAMTDEFGGETETSNYMPFGGMREHTGIEASDYKFTDQELDGESNLYNYDARLYDPVIGRFVSADLLLQNWYDPQTLNRFSYSRNNPLIYTDPSGHFFVAAPKDQKIYAEWINQKNCGLYGFNKYNKLVLLKKADNPASKLYQDRLIAATNSLRIIELIISDKYTANGEQKNVDNIPPGGGVTLSPTEGQGTIKVILSGNDSKARINDTEGNPLKYDPASILLHEILGHVSPRVSGTITGNAVENENKARAEMGEKLREAEPSHHEISPSPEKKDDLFSDEILSRLPPF